MARFDPAGDNIPETVLIAPVGEVFCTVPSDQ